MNRTEYIGKLNALYVGEKNCLEELITAYDEKDKEIERLKKINEEHRILNGELRKELEVEKDISDGMLKTIDRAKELMNEYRYTKVEEYWKIIEFFKKLEYILKESDK